MTNIKTILKKIDKTPEHTLRNKLFNGVGYIDTPGNYLNEKKDYDNDIMLYYKQNMGKNELAKLIDWIKNHPKQVKQFMMTH